MSQHKKYSIVYADPPWKYKVWTKKGQGGTAESHYSSQSLLTLKLLDIPAICNTNAVLLLWVTFPLLQEGLELGAAWGFEYKTVAFTWIKRNKRKHTLFVGMGHYTRANAEVVLLFTKGKPLKRISNSVQQILISSNGAHSQKPPEIRNRIVQLFGDVPRVELFARNRSGFFPCDEYLGWDVWGNEITGSITLPITSE